MTPQPDLAAIRAELRTLLEKATPIPWTLESASQEDAPNAALIVAAVNALPALMDRTDGIGERIDAIFDQVMEERRDDLIAEGAADRILARVVEARFLAASPSVEPWDVERVRTLERANGEVALLWAETNDRLDTLAEAAKSVLACGVGNLSGDRYRRRVEAFDALDDAVDARPPPDTGQRLVSDRVEAALRFEAAKEHRKLVRRAATVIGTNLVIDYGSEEAARAALDLWPSVEPLDVERVARAMMPIVWGKVPTEGNSPESVAEAEAAWASERDELRERARIFAAEYARLLPTQASDSPERPT